MRVAQSIELTESEIKTLTGWSRGRRTPARLMKRAKIVLMAINRWCTGCGKPGVA